MVSGTALIGVFIFDPLRILVARSIYDSVRARNTAVQWAMEHTLSRGLVYAAPPQASGALA